MSNCKQCKSSFEILPEDRRFYEMMQVPEPTLCYLCRMQRRLSFRSERFLYHRKCDMTGKQIISTYSTDKPFPVYNNDDWWSDRWNALQYGRDFDFSRPFFEQFFELRNKVPRLALIRELPMENSDYCNASGKCKNCYLCFSSNSNEDCYYCTWINLSKNCVDVLSGHVSELCYDCIGIRDCFNLKWSQDSSNCRDSYFLKNCIGCRDCFGCANLNNKQYYIFNKPQTKEQYEAFMKKVALGSFKVIETMKQKFDEMTRHQIVKEYEGVNTENSVGNYLRNTKNTYLCFEVENAEDVRYSNNLFKVKDCMDHSYWGDGSERIFECQAVGYSCYNIRFSNLCFQNASDLLYCDHCHSAKNCFGCVGLNKHQYCILNKQYSKSDYEALVSKIIEHMKKTGEWGQFFPPSYSQYGYNETLAYEHFLLTREQALAQGRPWKDPETEKNYKGPRTEIFDNIRDASEELCKRILLSEKSGDPYKVIPQEFKFYKENNIPIPRLTPHERHFEHLVKRLPRQLFDRKCQKCSKAIKTPYSPERPEVVYCEGCYLKEVY